MSKVLTYVGIGRDSPIVPLGSSFLVSNRARTRVDYPTSHGGRLVTLFVWLNLFSYVSSPIPDPSVAKNLFICSTVVGNAPLA